MAILTATTLVSCGGEVLQGADRNQSSRPLGIPVLERVRSGELEITLSFYGEAEDHLDMRLIGTFLGVGGEGLPLVDFGAEASGAMDGETIDVNTALIATRDRAVLTYDGETFETDRPTFEALETTFEGALGHGGGRDPAACLEALGRIDPGRIAHRDRKSTLSTMFDDTPIKVTSAEIQADDLAQFLRRLREDPACGAQLKAAGALARVLEEVEDGLERDAEEAEATLAVDKTGTMRELTVHVPLQGSRGEANLQIRLMHINEVTELPPCHGERPLSALVRKLGFDPLEPIENGQAEGLIGLLIGIYGAKGDETPADGRIAHSSRPA